MTQARGDSMAGTDGLPSEIYQAYPQWLKDRLQWFQDRMGKTTPASRAKAGWCMD